MKKLLVAALISVVIAISHTHAGEKFLTFSGKITYCNDENRSIVAQNDKKEISFFVAGSVFHDDSKIEMAELSKGCTVNITYQKHKRRFIANRVDVQDCQDTHQ